MKRSLVFVVLLSSIATLAQFGVDQDLQSAVNAGNQAWIDGMRSGDMNRVASAYAPDAVNCSADGQCTSGLSAIASQLRSRMASYGRAQTANVTTTNIVRDRDLAYEWGYAEANFGGGRTIRGRYFTVWQRQAGSWKILRNVSLPAFRDDDRLRDDERRRGRDAGPGTPAQSTTLRCESDDMGRHSCSAPFAISRADVLRQISGSPCTQGSTWGWSGDSIWVDRGCRAEFTVYASAGDSGPITDYNDSRVMKTIRCESDDMGYHFCSADGNVRRARLVRQVSGSACTETKTWGWKSDGVWVDKGCRADFEVTIR